MATRQANNDANAHAEGRQALKRRGLIAGAAALVAGIAAKQASQPVGAITTDTRFGAYGTTGAAFYTFIPQGSDFEYGVQVTASTVGVQGKGNDNTSAPGIQGIGGTPNGSGVLGYGTGTGTGTYGQGGSGGGIGVFGAGGGAGASAVGVLGYGGGGDSDGVQGHGTGAYSGTAGFGGANGGPGAYGQGGTPNGPGVKGLGAGIGPGVYGYGTLGVFGDATATGVYGQASDHTGAIGVWGHHARGNIGVYGDSNTGIGVSGFTHGGYGVLGVSESFYGMVARSTTSAALVASITGAGSESNPNAAIFGVGTVGPGIQGQSPGGHGLVGTTDATDGHAGLIGNANKAGGIGLMGIAPGYGTQSVGLAGDFFGNVKINGGTLMAPVMQTAIKHQGDGTYRALHSLATPEGWVEDFGKGTLSADKADITLDHDFAALIESDFHVFLTAHGPQHLHVAQQSGSGFTVIATPIGSAGGPKPAVGGGSFSWRVVGKRKDIASERLAKVAAPATPKAPAAFTITEISEVTPPTAPTAFTSPMAAEVMVPAPPIKKP